MDLNAGANVSAMSRDAGREVLKAALAEGDVRVRELAKKLGWSFQRTYSMLKTLAKKKYEKSLVKVGPGLYKLSES